MANAALYVRQLKLGPMDNFVYLVGAKASPEVVVIDPAWDVEAIERAAADDGKRIVAGAVSHSHRDHINGVPELLSLRDIPVYAQKAELEFSPELRTMNARPLSPGDTFDVGPLKLRALHTPGHTPGSQCLQVEDALVSGDTLFINGCGRCDLRGGNPDDMYRSISQVLMKLPDDTRLFPGHDYADVPIEAMGQVKSKNPYFQFHDLQSFVAYRMRPRK